MPHNMNQDVQVSNYFKCMFSCYLLPPSAQCEVVCDALKPVYRLPMLFIYLTFYLTRRVSLRAKILIHDDGLPPAKPGFEPGDCSDGSYTEMQCHSGARAYALEWRIGSVLQSPVRRNRNSFDRQKKIEAICNT